MGHANINVTLDRYGHLMPGSEAGAAELLEAYLMAERERAAEAVRAAQPGAFTGASWRTKPPSRLTMRDLRDRP